MKPKDNSKGKFNGRKQKDDIRKYLQAGGVLDASKAWRLFSCSKIATRVSEFLRDGQLKNLQKKRKTVLTKYGKVSIMTYRIAKL